MAKVIVERPRVGRSWAGLRQGRTRVILDDDGEPLRAREPEDPRPRREKHFNEHLGPLRRYLGSQVGRPWNKVFSEISENLKPTSTVQQHVRDHLKDYVAIKTRMQNGVVMAYSDRMGGERALEKDHRRYYVHPRTGLLKRNPHYQTWSRDFRAKREAEAAARDKRMRDIGDDRQLHLLSDGAWWEVRLAYSRSDHVVGSRFEGRHETRPLDHNDVVLNAGLSQLSRNDLYNRIGYYAVAKRPLSRKEKKLYGLS